MTVLLTLPFLIFGWSLAGQSQDEPERESSTVSVQADAREAMLRGKRELESGTVEGAIKELKRALALDPELAEAHMYLGHAYRFVRFTAMLSEANAELRHALALNPELVFARLSLAGIYLELDFPEKAKHVLEERLDLLAKEPGMLALLGEVNRRLGEPEAALELNRKALEKDPMLAIAHYYIGMAYLDRSEENEAIQAFRETVRVSPNRPDISGRAHRHLAEVLFGKGEYSEAAKHARKAEELGSPVERSLYRRMIEKTPKN